MTEANSSSIGTASSSSSLMIKSPLELSEFVVDREALVSLLVRPCPFFQVLSSSSCSSIKGSTSASRTLPPGFSCRSAAEGLYRNFRTPIFQGSRSKKPRYDELGIIVGS
jgi:hypothetical protein